MQQPVGVVPFSPAAVVRRPAAESPECKKKKKSRHCNQCFCECDGRLREPVESAESLVDEVEEASPDVPPVLPVRAGVRSPEDCGVKFVPDDPQLVGQSPDLQLLLLLRLSPGGSLML